jgi:hypothetical protein
MSVHPFGLKSISAHDRAALQSKAFRVEFELTFIDISQEILLTAAKGTRTPLSQKIEGEVVFGSVRPSKSELVADDRHMFQALLHRPYISHGCERKQGGVSMPVLAPSLTLKRIELRKWDYEY